MNRQRAVVPQAEVGEEEQPSPPESSQQLSVLVEDLCMNNQSFRKERVMGILQRTMHQAFAEAQDAVSLFKYIEIADSELIYMVKDNNLIEGSSEETDPEFRNEVDGTRETDQTNLCDDCVKVTLKGLLMTKGKSVGSRESRSFYLLLQNPLLTRQTCSLCKLILTHINEKIIISGPALIELSRPGYSGESSMVKMKTIYIVSVNGESNKGPYTYLSTAADSGTHAARFIPRRQVGEPLSRSTLRTIKSWLFDCDMKHPECHLGILGDNIATIPDEISELDNKVQMLSPLLPRRILFVGQRNGSDIAHLVITNNDQRGRYITLSHCWGGHTTVSTTKSNIEQFTQYIDYNLMPKTFRDAITMTRKLGFNYLWIDSLCIIQDDREDWERESRVMCSIYENAHCTLAATCCINSNEGFLHPHERQTTPHGLDYLVAKLPCDLDDSTKGVFYLINQVAESASVRIEDARLNHRGWVFQERLISRRTIHFAKDQVYWECRRHLVGEDGSRHDEVPDNSTAVRSLGITQVVPAFAVLKQSFDQPTVASDPFLFGGFRDIIEETWELLLSEYSRRELSVPGDRLHALAGIAEKLQTLTGLKYTDGIFVDDSLKLSPSFCWIVWHKGNRPDIKRSPSWSWAAVDGRIGFINNCLNQAAILLQINTPRYPGPRSFTTLRLSGRMRTAYSVPPVRIRPNGTRLPYEHPRSPWCRIFDPGLSYAPFSPGDVSIGKAFFDPGEKKLAKFTCVEIFSGGDEVVIFIIVAENHSDKRELEYRRIGAGEIWKSSYFDSCPKITFTLV